MIWKMWIRSIKPVANGSCKRWGGPFKSMELFAKFWGAGGLDEIAWRARSRHWNCPWAGFNVVASLIMQPRRIRLWLWKTPTITGHPDNPYTWPHIITGKPHFLHLTDIRYPLMTRLYYYYSILRHTFTSALLQPSPVNHTLLPTITTPVIS